MSVYMILVCMKNFTANRTYSNNFFGGSFYIDEMTDDERKSTGLYCGKEIRVSGSFKYIYRGSRYRVDIEPGDVYRGQQNWKAVTIAEAPSTRRDMKRCIHRAGTSAVTDDDIDNIWDVFGRNWYSALTAGPKTKRHARLKSVLGSDYTAKMAVLVEHFYNSSWYKRMVRTFPSMSEGTAKALSKLLDKVSFEPVAGFDTDEALFNSWVDRPWTMAEHLGNGVLWKSIDKAALVDVDKGADDVERIAYAIYAYIKKAIGYGSTCFNLKDFRGHEVYQEFLMYAGVPKSVSFSGPIMYRTRSGQIRYDERPSVSVFNQALKYAIQNNILKNESFDGVPYVTDKLTYKYEVNIARRLASTCRSALFDEDTMDNLLDDYSYTYDRDLDFSQRDAVRCAMEYTTSVVCGRPGYGKSAVIDAIAFCLRRQINPDKPEQVLISILTLSGMAGQRIRDEHVVGVNSDESVDHPGYKNSDVMTIAKALRSEERIKESSVVIIDETSMCSNSDIGRIAKLVGPLSHLVLVGDDAQLPPIGSGAPFSDIVSNADDMVLPFPVTTLSVNHRLGRAIGAEGLAEAFDAVRMRDISIWDKRVEDESIHVHEVSFADKDLTYAVVDKYMERLKACRGNFSDVVVLTPTHSSYLGRLLISMLIRERVCPESDVRIDFDSVARSDYTCDVVGTPLRASGIVKDDETLRKPVNMQLVSEFGLKLYKNYSAKKNLPADDPRNFCVGFRIGDRVMCNKTDFDLYNGDVGTITKFSCGAGESYYQGMVTIKLDRGLEIELPLSELSRRFDLGYALTVHKSQGCEFYDVIFCVENTQGDFVDNRMLYTALTRTKRRVDVFSVSGVTRSVINIDGRARQTLLIERLESLI